MSNSLWPHGLQPTRLLCPWGFSRQQYWSGLPCPPPLLFINSAVASDGIVITPAARLPVVVFWYLSLFPDGRRRVWEGSLFLLTVGPQRPSLRPACSGAWYTPLRYSPEAGPHPPLTAPPGAVLLQRQSDGRAAGWGQHTGLPRHGPQGPHAAPKKRHLPARVRLVTCPAARCPEQGERKMSGPQPLGSQACGFGTLWGGSVFGWGCSKPGECLLLMPTSPPFQKVPLGSNLILPRPWCCPQPAESETLFFSWISCCHNVLGVWFSNVEMNPEFP